MVRDGHVRLARLGTFRLGRVAEHLGVNPQSGDRMVIPEHTRILFRPAHALANQVNAEYNHLQSEPLKQTGNPADNPDNADPEPESEQEAQPVEEEKPTEEKKPAAEKKPPTPPPPLKKSPTTMYALIGAAVVVVIILLFFVFRGGEEETVAPEPEVSPPAGEVQPQPPVEPEPVVEPEVTPEPEPETDFAYEPEPVEEEYEPAPSTVYIQGTPAQIHIVHRTDNLWNLADFYYQEATFWPLILQANKPLRFNPDLLFTGIDLVVPMLEGMPEDLTSADRSNLADAYLEAFESYRNIGKPDADEYLRRSERYSQ